MLVLVLMGTLHSVHSSDEAECERRVDEAAWRQLLPFLPDTSVAAAAVCVVETAEGNYTGQLRGGLRHGWGEMRWRNGTLYGDTDQFYYSRGDRYLGQWEAGRQHGLGTLFSQTGVYVGAWRDGLQSGNGSAIYNNGNRYEGEFSRGFKHGHGVFSVANGDRYSGQFRRGRRHGEGIELFHTGERYVGGYEADQRQGRGTAYYATGQVKYTGEEEVTRDVSKESLQLSCFRRVGPRQPPR